MSDVVASTAAIRAGQYKIVNIAGGALIVAVSNALDRLDFPFAFGGDGASFALPLEDAETARAVLTATAAWVQNDLSHAAGGFDAGGGGPHRRLGCARGTLCPFIQCQLCHVHGRRLGLGRTRDESWRQSRRACNNGHAARPDWLVVPLAGIS
jgi:hypothetical protein